MNERKKILCLGGSLSQLPLLKYAKNAGHHIVLCDYHENNPGRRLSDEFHHISTIDKAAVLDLARSRNVDGVISYASDVNVVTQAYVAEALGLPGNPYESVLTLTRKDRFRKLLYRLGLPAPRSESFKTVEEAETFAKNLDLPLIVKPVDNAGSQGVKKIESLGELREAFDYAISFSRNDQVIVEEFFEKNGYQYNGDGFVVNGEWRFRCWANSHRDLLCNPLVPVGNTFSVDLTKEQLDSVDRSIQKIIDALEIRQGPFNVEFIFDKKGNPVIIDIGPRNGGNFASEVIQRATGVDLMAQTVNAALGYPCDIPRSFKLRGYFASWVIHARKDGILKEIRYKGNIEKNILEKYIYLSSGDRVEKFMNTKQTIALFIMSFSSHEEMLQKTEHMDEYVEVVVTSEDKAS